jgi:hypothetical protein
VQDLSLIDIEPEIAEIVKFYIQNQVMPNDPLGDALHLAIASYHKCDFLLTWNCRHLANANKFGHKWVCKINYTVAIGSRESGVVNRQKIRQF